MSKTANEKKIVALEAQVKSLTGELEYAKKHAKSHEDYSNVLKKEKADLEDRFQEEVNSFYSLYNDLHQIKEKMVHFGEIFRPDQKRFEVSLERHYGRIEGLLREMITKHQPKRGVMGMAMMASTCDHRERPF